MPSYCHNPRCKIPIGRNTKDRRNSCSVCLHNYCDSCFVAFHVHTPFEFTSSWGGGRIRY